MFKKWIILLVTIFFCSTCIAQKPQYIEGSHNRIIDSLLGVLSNINNASTSEFVPTVQGQSQSASLDTFRINTNLSLAWQFCYSNPDTAIVLCMQALVLSKDLFKTEENLSVLGKKRESYIAKCFQMLGILNKVKGNYSASLDYYFKALKIFESQNNKTGIAKTFGGIGNIYMEQGNLPNALEFHLKGLKVAEEIGDKISIARQQGNLGNVFCDLKEYDKALEYYHKAVSTARELNVMPTVSVNLGNVGNVYFAQDNYTKALEYYSQALELDRQLGNKQGVARHLCNMGNIYSKQISQIGKGLNKRSLDSLCRLALTTQEEALDIFNKIGDKGGIGATTANIGGVYLAMNRYKEAETYIQNAAALCSEIGVSYTSEIEKALSELYEKMNQPAKAFEHYKKYIAAKDSLYNEENTKQMIHAEMNFEYEKKQAVTKAEQDKQNAIAEEEKQRNRIVLGLVSFILLLVAVLAGFMYTRWRITKRQNKIIENQKSRIVDSIVYAQLIQRSILVEEREIKKYLPESFVFLRPKDIVSGDFYWFSVVGDKIIIAAVDCTGHGVPGAFMSMVGNTLLNQIVNEKHTTVPSEILRLLNIGICEALHQKQDNSLTEDGMDIALCCIDYKSNLLQYAGANNPLIFIKDNKLNVIDADFKSIGGSMFVQPGNDIYDTTYLNHALPIEKGMTIYLFSDGFADQFGGDNKKKLGSQRFKDLLLEYQHLRMEEQGQALAAFYKKWKEGQAQIDDVLVIGVRL